MELGGGGKFGKYIKLIKIQLKVKIYALHIF